MQKITVTLGGQEFTGLPLTLDQLEQIAKEPPSDLNVLRIWLADPATEPKSDGPARAYFRELAPAVKAILGTSELSGEEKPAEATA